MRKIAYELDEREVAWSAVRSQGAGGQNVNKVASAVQLRFDVRGSSLPERLKERILARRDRRLTAEGVLVIKSEIHRTQELNRSAAMERLRAILAEASEIPDFRIPTRPTRGSKRRTRKAKESRSALKQARRKVTDFS